MTVRSANEDRRANDRDDPQLLGLLASAISGRALRIAPGEPGESAWTDGSAIFVDPGADLRRQVESVAVQASLLSAGSLAPDVARALARRPALARRYLAVEGHRALAAVEFVLPPSVRSLIDPGVAAGTGSPAESLTAAQRGTAIPDPPESFGRIRARRLLKAMDRSADANAPEAKRPRAPGEQPTARLADRVEDEAFEDGGAFEGFASPGGRGGAVGRLFARLLAAVRQRRGGGPVGAETATHRSRAGRPTAGSTTIATRWTGALEAIAFERRGVTYPEWDAQRHRYRPDWCTVHEVEQRPDAASAPAATDLYGLRRPLTRLGMGLDRYHRQAFGDDIDIDAAIEARVEVIAGSAPEENFYIDSLRLRRDLSILLLLDVSGSSAEPAATVADGRTVHEQQRSVAAALATALHDIGDRVALYAFRSRGRSAVHLIPVKRFDETLDAVAMRRLHSLVPGMYSRLGAAIRHGTTLLKENGGTPRRLLVVLSDGLAYDHGYEPAYGAADARRALAEARREGVGCLCLGIGTGTDAQTLRRVFGSAAHANLSTPTELGRVIGPLFRSALRSAEAARRVAA